MCDKVCCLLYRFLFFFQLISNNFERVNIDVPRQASKNETEKSSALLTLLALAATN